MKLTKNNILQSSREDIVKILKKKDYLNTFTLKTSPGHYYSPIPKMEDVQNNREEIFNREEKEIPGIDLNIKEQLQLLKNFKTYYNKLPFTKNKHKKNRFYYNAQWFNHFDAIILFCMIMHFKPNRIIEIGSGISSALMLDTNELFFDNKINITCIDPHPERLVSMLKKHDLDRNLLLLLKKKIQDTDLEIFDKLEKNDILFIDSSHISKIDSDVNKILFDIIPKLKKGTIIHIHDITYPFEYLEEWVRQGLAFNECYLIRSFLQYNSAFKILSFNSLLYMHYKKILKKYMPLALENYNVHSLWIKKEV